MVLNNGIKIAILTLNLNNSQPNEANINYEQFGASTSGLDVTSHPDIVVIGAQEIVKYKTMWKYATVCKQFSTPNLFTTSNDLNDDRVKWIINFSLKLTNCMFAGTKYVFRAVYTWYGLITIVSVKSSFRAYIGHISHSVHSTGLGKLYPNKGALAVLLEVNLKSFNSSYPRVPDTQKVSDSLIKTKICFVNAHLQAHEGLKNKRTRSSDALSIMENLFFYNNNNRSSRTKIYENDVIFFFGDLNCRLEYNHSHRNDVLNFVKNMITHNKVDSILTLDESSNFLNEHDVFKFFKEPKITFMPTYKKKVSRPLVTNNSLNSHLDTYNFQKRLPAYCDRIFFSSTNDSGIRKYMVSRKQRSPTINASKPSFSPSSRQLNSDNYMVNCITYNSVLNGISSDHDPVLGLFNIYPVKKNVLIKTKREPSIFKCDTIKTIIKHFLQLLFE